MRRFAPILFLLSLISVTTLLGVQQTIFVRPDGSDTLCNGSADANTAAAPDCAKLTFNDPNGALATVIGADADIIKVKAGTYNEQILVDPNDATLTITATDPNGPKPYIGGTYIRYNDPNVNDWTLVSGTNDVYQATWTGGTVWSAYIQDFPYYENERIGLIPYPTLEMLKATNMLCCSGDYYRGPGFFRSGSTIYVRLAATPQVTSYEQTILPLFEGDLDPDNYDLLFSDSTYTLRVNAGGVTISNLLIESNKHAIELCTEPGSDPNNITIDEVTAWAGNDGGLAVDPNCDSISNLTIRNSQFYADIPYWVSWTDCKGPTSPTSEDPFNPVCDAWRFTLLSFGSDSGGGSADPNIMNLQIRRNHLRGGHDGIGFDAKIGPVDPNIAGATIAYNRIENMADDPIELEAQSGDTVNRIDIYGNFFGNSLECGSFGQDSGNSTWNGPIYYFNNVCALIRPQYINSDGDCDANPWNSRRCYGGEYAFKWGGDPPDDHNIYIYNNTIVAGLNNTSEGLRITGGNHATSTTGRIFNNILSTINGRVGESSFNNSSAWTQIDYNLYFSMNNPSSSLAGSSLTIPELFTARGVEQHGIGEFSRVGTNPAFTVNNGFGCLVNGSCTTFKTSDPIAWTADPPSWIWRISHFARPANSPGCAAGRGGVAALGLPVNTVDPNGTIAFDPNSMGAIPCGASTAGLEYTPQTLGWHGKDEFGSPHAVNQAPLVDLDNFNYSIPTIGDISPRRYLTKTTAGASVNFCGGFLDPDGGPPFTYLWDFTGTGCPSDNTNICPGAITFSNVATCTVVFSVTDRAGAESTKALLTGPNGLRLNQVSDYQRVIYVLPAATSGSSGQPSGGCSDCTKCVCDRVN